MLPNLPPKKKPKLSLPDTNKSQVGTNNSFGNTPVAITRPIQKLGFQEICDTSRTNVVDKSYEKRSIETQVVSPTKFDDLRPKTKTIGVVEPRVVVKIPWSKVVAKSHSMLSINNDSTDTRTTPFSTKKNSSLAVSERKHKRPSSSANCSLESKLITPLSPSNLVHSSDNNDCERDLGHTKFNTETSHKDKSFASLKRHTLATEGHTKEKLCKMLYRDITDTEKKDLDLETLQIFKSKNTKNRRKHKHEKCDTLVSNTLPDHFKKALHEHQLQQQQSSCNKDSDSSVNDLNRSIRSTSSLHLNSLNLKLSDGIQSDSTPNKPHRNSFPNKSIETLKLVRNNMPGDTNDQYKISISELPSLTEQVSKNQSSVCDHEVKLLVERKNAVLKCKIDKRNSSTNQRFPKNLYSSNEDSENDEVIVRTKQKLTNELEDRYETDNDGFAKYKNDTKCFMFSDLVVSTNKIEDRSENSKIHKVKKNNNKYYATRKRQSSKSYKKAHSSIINRCKILREKYCLTRRILPSKHYRKKKTKETRQKKHRYLASTSTNEERSTPVYSYQPKREDESILSETINCIGDDKVRNESKGGYNLHETILIDYKHEINNKIKKEDMDSVQKADLECDNNTLSSNGKRNADTISNVSIDAIGQETYSKITLPNVEKKKDHPISVVKQNNLIKESLILSEEQKKCSLPGLEVDKNHGSDMTYDNREHGLIDTKLTDTRTEENAHAFKPAAVNPENANDSDDSNEGHQDDDVGIAIQDSDHDTTKEDLVPKQTLKATSEIEMVTLNFTNGYKKETNEVEHFSKTPANISIEYEADGDWMFCKITGCSFWTRKKVRMDRHKLSHVPGDNRVYQCPDCDLKMCSLPKLLRHDRKLHTGFKDYECKICEAEVTDIAVHMRVSN